MKMYPGARDAIQALVFRVAHQEMRIENAVRHYSYKAHARDDRLYASGWIDRIVEYADDLMAAQR